MTVNQRGVFSRSLVGCALLLLPGCGSSGGSGSTGGAPGSLGGTSSGTGGSSLSTGGSSSSTGGSSLGTGGSSLSTGGSSPSTGGTNSAGTANSGGQGAAGASTSGGRAAGGQGPGGTASGGEAGATASGGAGPGTGGRSGSGGTGVQGGRSGTGGQTVGGTGTGGGSAGPCVGKEWPTADPTTAGPFGVASEKNVGPLAGALPDPVYGDQQQRFNVYHPKELATSGYCHPILVWANGHGDNPEQNPPKCVVDSGANKWCGTYPPLINNLVSHGFVVVASLSTTTSQGNPLPTIVGLNWLLEQAEDSASPYYHRLDTAHIGAVGHSEGGMSTCKAASDPRIVAMASICGTTAVSGLHGPALFFCGGKDTVVSCDGVKNTYSAVKDQPAMFINNLASDHGGWLGQNGAKGPTIFGVTAWFRVHLMGDTENRKRFFGSSCTFCSDDRVQVDRNSLMTQ